MRVHRFQGRRGRARRGVSPIIATILLGAITVVLAAILYILVSGVTHGPANTPLGSAFAYGRSSETTVTAAGAATPGCSRPASGTEYCYQIAIGQSSNGLSTADIGFALHTPAGVVMPFLTVTLLDQSGSAIAQYAEVGGQFTWNLCPVASSGVCNAPGSTLVTTLPAPVTSSDTMILDAGNGGTVSGDNFLALGMGAYSGDVQSSLPYPATTR
jgi:flagellin-like protein